MLHIKRTKSALKAAKARGVELGKYGKRLAEKHKEGADKFAMEIGPYLKRLFIQEQLSTRQIADRLKADITMIWKK